MQFKCLRQSCRSRWIADCQTLNNAKNDEHFGLAALIVGVTACFKSSRQRGYRSRIIACQSLRYAKVRKRFGLALPVSCRPGSLQSSDMQDAHLRPVTVSAQELTHGGGDYDPWRWPPAHCGIVNDGVHIGTL